MLTRLINYFITPPNINFPKVSAFFTTKTGFIENKKIVDALAAEFNISSQSIYLPVQKHTDSVQILNDDIKPSVADAVITDRKGMLIGVLVADCVPVLLMDRSRMVIAAVHAGWKGTAEGILKKTIDRMNSVFFCRHDDIFIAIGPSIRQCSYEVDTEVKDAVKACTGEGNYIKDAGNKYYIDLSTANRVQAVNCGVPEKNIWQSEECTYCNPDKFHSYRYSKGSAGRQGGFIGMW